MLKTAAVILLMLGAQLLRAQPPARIPLSFMASDSIRVTIDMPADFSGKKASIITFYALPNGSSTEQTMGKKIVTGDNPLFDAQHILAQTKFIRQQMPQRNFVVVYLENNNKSWPAWKQKHADFRTIIPHLLDSLIRLVPGKHKAIYLNGHSGGGSFIFGYLAAVPRIPAFIKRISFLDSDYGYDSSYYSKFRDWLLHTRGSALNVFAYNDSVALYQGKTFVSPTGGTWYRSHLFLHQLQADFDLRPVRNDSLIVYASRDARIQFFLKPNPHREIFHTVQVARNGFIHSVLCGTPFDSRNYVYYGQRAYADLIE